MAGSAKGRRQSRRKAFELLFELEQHPQQNHDSILERTFTDPDVSEFFSHDDDKEGYVTGPFDAAAERFVRELVTLVRDHGEALDDELAKYPIDWSYERIGAIERILLRLALAEILLIGTSYKVVINESLDMAKLYAQEDARRFINGILGAVVKNLDETKYRVRTLAGLPAEVPLTVEAEAEEAAELQALDELIDALDADGAADPSSATLPEQTDDSGKLAEETEGPQ